jgi:hypothetical protein
MSIMFHIIYAYLFTDFYENFRSKFIGDQKLLNSYLRFT